MRSAEKKGKEGPPSRSNSSITATSNTRVTRSTTKNASTTEPLAENSKNTVTKKKLGYSQPTKSTLRKKAQSEAAQKSEQLNTDDGVDNTGANDRLARKRKLSGTETTKRTKLPITKSATSSKLPITKSATSSKLPLSKSATSSKLSLTQSDTASQLSLTQSVTHSSSSAPKTPEKVEPKKILMPKDLGVGYLQYLSPCEAALYTAYHNASPDERLAMIAKGEVDDKEVEMAFALEHVFDHLPVPGVDFEPVEAAEGPEMYLEPGLRELFLLEKAKKLGHHYLNHQSFSFVTRTDVVNMMAIKLTDATWRRDTFLLAVNILDTVLSRGELRRKELVVYAVACIQIALKLNERFLMGHEELTANIAEEVSKAKVERAEMNILNFLDFDVYCIPAHQFLIRINQVDKFNKPLLTMSKYLLEVSLFDLDLVTELSSKVAAASYALARRILIDSSWSPSRHYYSGYSLEELEPLIDLLIGAVKRISTDGNMFSHYNTEKRFFVSDRVHAVLCPGFNQSDS